MKKLLYLLLLLPFTMLVSCSDKDDLPAVDLDVQIAGVTQLDGQIYGVVGDTISIKGISVKALNGKGAAIANVNYFIDGFPVFYTGVAPFRMVLMPGSLHEGVNTIGMVFNVLEVDKSIATASFEIPIKTVASEELLPTGAPDLGVVTDQITINPK